MSDEYPTLGLVVCALSTRDLDGFWSRNLHEFASFDQIVAVLQDPARPVSCETTSTAGSRVTIVRVPTLGYSNARNVALSHLQTDWCYFADDDGTILRGSADVLLTRIGEGSSDVILGVWVEKARPSLLPSDRYEIACSFSSIEVAYRVSALLDAGKFDPLLGVGAIFASAEDTDMLYRVLSRGYRAEMEPGFRVSHPVAGRRVGGRSPRAVAFDLGLGYGAFSFKAGRSIGRATLGALAVLCRSSMSAGVPIRASSAAGRLVGYFAYRVVVARGRRWSTG